MYVLYCVYIYIDIYIYIYVKYWPRITYCSSFHTQSYGFRLLHLRINNIFSKVWKAYENGESENLKYY